MNGSPSGAVTVSALLMMVSLEVGGAGAPGLGGGGVLVQERVEISELALLEEAVSVDPGGHRFQAFRDEVDGPTLSLQGAGDTSGLHERHDVLGVRLLSVWDWLFLRFCLFVCTAQPHITSYLH